MERVMHVRKLYKTILRLHRSLPVELRALGNEYAREEFKRHKKCKESEAVMFLNEWTNYAISLRGQFSTKNMNPQTMSDQFGKNMDPELLEHMRDEQIAQLYELMKATKEQKDSEKQ